MMRQNSQRIHTWTVRKMMKLCVRLDAARSTLALALFQCFALQKIMI